MKAALLPARLGVGEEDDLILARLLFGAHLEDPGDHALQAGRVDEAEIVQVDEHAGGQVVGGAGVNRVEEGRELLLHEEIGGAGQLHAQDGVVDGQGGVEGAVLDDRERKRGHTVSSSAGVKGKLTPEMLTRCPSMSRSSFISASAWMRASPRPLSPSGTVRPSRPK